MKYTEKEIDAIFTDNLKMATASLSSIPVAMGRPPSFQGLNGWVYEQTIRYCLEDELNLLGVALRISEQFQLKGRARADLLVGNVAIEIKAGGLFGDDSEKYKKYKIITQERNISYIYVTRQESHQPYRLTTQDVFGSDMSFFLTEEESWKNFVMTIIALNSPTTASSGRLTQA